MDDIPDGPKKGDIRADGRVFVGYRVKAKGGKKYEIWLSQEALENRKASIRARKKKWRKENPEKLREQKRRELENFKLKYPERFKDRKRKERQSQRKKNPQKFRDEIKRYKKENVHIKNNQDMRRKTRVINGSLMLHADQNKMMEVIYDCRTRISRCLGITFHVDHIIPISRGGFHIPSNLQILPQVINLRKNAKLPEEFPI